MGFWRVYFLAQSDAKPEPGDFGPHVVSHVHNYFSKGPWFLLFPGWVVIRDNGLKLLKKKTHCKIKCFNCKQFKPVYQKMNVAFVNRNLIKRMLNPQLTDVIFMRSIKIKL